jgi:erythronate-4-phosphate dehydrogenase
VVVALLTCRSRLPAALARGPLGIIGVGQVGSRLAALVRSLGLVDEVLCCDPPRARRGDADETWLALDELWARSSIVSLHVPLVREGPDRTLALIDAAHPRPSGPKLLVNTCRGPVVPDRALARPDIVARVLDVHEREPELDAATLLDPRTLLCSPHVAGYSLEAKLRASAMMHAALSRWLGREPSVDLLATLPRVIVPRTLEPLARLHRIVDLAGDDARVRALFELPVGERAAAFEALRRSYVLRRELSSCAVEGGEPLLAAFERPQRS